MAENEAGGKPKDKIVCQRKYYRYVVACMHNCPFPNYCEEFWGFFESRKILPKDYYNIDGIGEKVMKRIVYDCDRCGKKDIGGVYSHLYHEGETENQPLPDAQFIDRMKEFKESGLIDHEIFRRLLSLIRDAKDWQHFCGACFRKLLALTGIMLNVRRKAVKPPAAKPAPPAKSITLQPLPAAVKTAKQGVENGTNALFSEEPKARKKGRPKKS
ncbi:MAG: hypothetical protein FJ088_03260 [Deltaproteobacteria bacterium]|nr:hypothetical protein [Deltaproteobacteria bacterium]